ncbi:MAG TPA: class I SAM-dependent methyltransferase [Solirubrobacterales bacterium]|nr:class I SAM-dependent methyltransferase [Solirubrobacterales bacterium]
MKTVRNENGQGAERAYDAIAAVYDDFTAHHDYELWLGNLLPRIESHGIRGRRLLDVACGTGKSFIPLLEDGWEVTACDVSAAMVEIAREKVGDEAELAVADMRELPVFGEFDLIWCLDDAVNYLLEGEELERALAAMGRNLGPQGLLAFDVNTLASYRTFFAEEVTVEQRGRRMTWRGHGSPEQGAGAIFEASLTVEGADEVSVHRSRHYPEAEVLAALAAAGLEAVDVFGHDHAVIPEQPLDEVRHTKAVYVARTARG